MSHRNGNDELYVMNADGTGQARLTNCATLLAACRNPRWSPAAGDQRILYNFFGATSSLRTIMANGAAGGVTVLPGLAAYDVSWSPDATRLTFAYVAPGLVYLNIYTAALDGSGLTRLTFETLRSESEPAWSR
jgi:TolB protein